MSALDLAVRSKRLATDMDLVDLALDRVRSCASLIWNYTGHKMSRAIADPPGLLGMINFSDQYKYRSQLKIIKTD